MSLAGIVPWGWRPDWSGGVLEWLEWLTDVLPAVRGEEQRRALRTLPRQQLEFRCMVSGPERTHLENVLWTEGGPFAVPIWPDGLALESPLASGATTVPLDTADRQFAVGDLVAFLGPGAADVELGEVTAVGAYLGLAAETSRTWPAGTLVLPARAARLQEAPSWSRFTGDTSIVRLRFDMDRPATWPADAGAATYRGYPVLEQAIDWSTDPAVEFTRRREEFDSDTGPVATRDLPGRPLAAMRARHALLSRAEISQWRARLFTLQGRRGAIWVPSWQRDFEPVAAIGSGETTLDVAWCGASANVGDPLRRDLRLELQDGTVLYRRITDATDVGGGAERLTLDAPLGVDVAPLGFALVSWLSLMRQETDTAELAWWSDEAAQTACSYRGFRHDV